MKLIKDLGMIYRTKNSKKKARYGLYECPLCAKHVTIYTANITNGHTTKCKSCSNSIAKTTHGMTHHKLFDIWVSEQSRCNNKKSQGYKYYGGRGIRISEEFSDVKIWIKYVESLDNAYKPTYSLNRIDNDGNYERGNIEWAPKHEQSQNTRLLSKRNTSGYRGVTKSGRLWRARITNKGENIELGFFDYPWTAALVRDSYVIKNKSKHTLNYGNQNRNSKQ